MTTESVRTDSTSHGPVRAVMVGTVVAIVGVLIVYAAARAAGDDLLVTPQGRPTGAVPVGAAIGATLLAGVLAWLLATIVRRMAAPRRWFLVVAVLGLLVSFGPPFAAAEQTSTALWLCLMHVAVAAALVPLTVRALPAGAR